MTVSGLISHITLLHEISATASYNGPKEAPSLKELQKLPGFGAEPCPAWPCFEQSVQNKQLWGPSANLSHSEILLLHHSALCCSKLSARETPETEDKESHQYLLFIWTREPIRRTLQILPTPQKTEVIYLKVLTICHSYRWGKRTFVVFVTALMIKWINTYIQCKKILFLDLKVISVKLDRSIHSDFLPSCLLHTHFTEIAFISSGKIESFGYLGQHLQRLYLSERNSHRRAI